MCFCARFAVAQLLLSHRGTELVDHKCAGNSPECTPSRPHKNLIQRAESTVALRYCGAAECESVDPAFGFGRRRESRNRGYIGIC